MEQLPEENKKEEYSWKQYYELHAAMPHTKSLEIAVNDYCKNGGEALDLGAGNLRDTKFLLEKGFKVRALDPSPDSALLAEELHHPNLIMVPKLIRDYDFPENYFSLINAQGILFHLPIQRLKAVISKIKNSLKHEGVFTVELLGLNDDWNKEESEKTFLSKEQLEELLNGFEIIYLDEYERNVTSAASEIAGTNELKHWHKFRIIAIKK
jgi:tellurite methyltransferase